MKDADVTQQAGPASPALPIFPRFPSSCSEHGRKLLGQRVQGRARLALHGWIPRGGGDRKSSEAFSRQTVDLPLASWASGSSVSQRTLGYCFPDSPVSDSPILEGNWGPQLELSRPKGTGLAPDSGRMRQGWWAWGGAATKADPAIPHSDSSPAFQ